jgi:hypothetical protein
MSPGFGLQVTLTMSFYTIITPAKRWHKYQRLQALASSPAAHIKLRAGSGAPVEGVEVSSGHHLEPGHYPDRGCHHRGRRGHHWRCALASGAAFLCDNSV